MAAARRQYLKSDSAAPERSDDCASPALPSFIRIPPFPGAKIMEFSPRRVARDGDAERLADLIRQERVGGTYWAAQPELPARYRLIRNQAGGDITGESAGSDPIVRWDGVCDPWHMLAGASAFFVEADDEAIIIAALLNVPTYVDGNRTQANTSAYLRDLAGFAFTNPFSGAEMTAEDAVTLSGFWRRLIDSNRDLAGAIGFAFWKQENVAPLLWGGDKPVAFLNSASSLSAGRPVAAWLSKSPADEISRLSDAGVPIVEVEDGFLRSRGLGADCVPPLSITVDRLGAYFDPCQPSELESLLELGTFDEELLERARQLRALIVEAGLGKYERGASDIERPAGKRRHILVTGQVEDDRSVLTGGYGLSNLELLRRVRQEAPEAYILYKPHPDVLAGHRKGAIQERACLELADEISDTPTISSLLAMVDDVHVNTSLAGFEALLRDKPVTTWGVPFYAGWGLTRDMVAIPARRTARRSIDELVAAALLIYPRYLDPLTGLPCPAEIVVDRLANGAPDSAGGVVRLRRLQGKLMRRFREATR